MVTLPYEKKLVGVLELLNKEGGERFSEPDERLAKELAPILGNAYVRARALPLVLLCSALRVRLWLFYY